MLGTKYRTSIPGGRIGGAEADLLLELLLELLVCPDELCVGNDWSPKISGMLELPGDAFDPEEGIAPEVGAPKDGGDP